MSATPRGGDNPLEPLLVLDRLEVGPTRVEARSLKTRYRVAVGDTEEESELSYVYEEDVFDAADPGSRNLASMIGAQVALNYGLFCRELVFHGSFDKIDRAFLTEMAANTAREIYVNKILKPNPLLTAAARVPVDRWDSYLQAELRFPDLEETSPEGRDAEEGGHNPGTGAWTGSGRRIAVLSSGGKESLLSYGLLTELGYDTHAVFLNESGRHWYTALNGYRHLRDTVPHRTVRVWTSADRVFNWMLRRLPLVRADYQSIRADDYPIRLWTVAVFLFGALPVVRKRGIGRIVIGDEYDTTRNVSYRGIPHYDGLYDQSRLFDNALSLYYRRKGWGLAQFSVLRPVSELLIQKTIFERYPELQRHQTSCHATSIREDRTYPCGKCEKCRRVVSMLVALGGDPTRCGYTTDQTERCLREVTEERGHQDAPTAQHTLWLLRESGRIEGSSGAQVKIQARPEVMSLRFDPRRSPVHGIPRAMRRALFSLLLEHADGALKKAGRQWLPLDLVSDQMLTRPYRFESPGTEMEAIEDGPMSKRMTTGARDYLLGELTWPQAEQRLAEVDCALLPVGAIEQHGPHLPLDTDSFDAGYLCLEVARRCEEPRPLVLPLIPYGVSYHHQDFPGTISVGPDTLARLVHDVGMSVARHGVNKLIIVNGHGGNVPALQFAAQMINRDAHIFTCVETGETSNADVARVTETPSDVHAGEVETSTSLAVRPELVDLPQARKFVPRFSSRYLDFSSEHAVEWYARTARISPSGVLGDPTKASAEKGQEIWEIMIRHLVSFVENLKSLTLAEIHERRS